MSSSQPATADMSAATPITALIDAISPVRVVGRLEPNEANNLLQDLVIVALSTHPDLVEPIQRYGWLPIDDAFKSAVDVPGLVSALQKFLYQRLDDLGSGAYGVVYKARNRETNEVLAVKKPKYSFNDDGFPGSTIREISALKELQHENIVQLKDIISMVDGSYVYFVLECLDCDLRTYLNDCNEASHLPNIKSIVYQILKAVHHAHANMVMHRDLKPQNILVDKALGRIKVTDFGLARPYLPPGKAYTKKVVTLYYRAPELLLGAPTYSNSVDLWSVGCIMAELINFDPLFKADSEIGLLYKIFEALGTPTNEQWSDIQQTEHFHAEFPRWRAKDMSQVVPRIADDPDAQDLLLGLLTYDPNKRLTAKQALEHRWFRDVALPNMPPPMAAPAAN